MLRHRFVTYGYLFLMPTPDMRWTEERGVDEEESRDIRAVHRIVEGYYDVSLREFVLFLLRNFMVLGYWRRRDFCKVLER